jgi:hypothetical protein
LHLQRKSERENRSRYCRRRKKSAREPKFYHGRDWRHLSEEEEFVFDIKRERSRRSEIDDDDWSAVNVLWDDLNQAIADFYQKHDRCTDSGGQQINEVHLGPWTKRRTTRRIQSPGAARFRAASGVATHRRIIMNLSD